MTNQNISTWASKIELGEIYDEFNENLKLLTKAHDAMENFCRKEKKRTKFAKKRRASWS